VDSGRPVTAEERAAFLAAVLGRMGHDLRTPLNAILGFAQVLEADRSLPSGARETAGEILLASQELTNLLDRAADLLALEEGRFPVDLGQAPLLLAVDEAVRRARPRATAHQIALEVDVPASLEVRTDPRRLLDAVAGLVDKLVVRLPPGATVRLVAAPTPSPSGKVRLWLRTPEGGMRPSARGYLAAALAEGQGELLDVELLQIRRALRRVGAEVAVEGAAIVIDLPAAER